MGHMSARYLPRVPEVMLGLGAEPQLRMQTSGPPT